jgi:hypothetical protein
MMVGMAECGSRVAGSGSSGAEDAGDGAGVSPLAVRPRRVVALRTTSGPARAVAPAWAAESCPARGGMPRRAPSAAPGWAGDPDVGTASPDEPGEGTGGWSAVCAPSASALAESVFPFGSELPFEPDPEAAAFLNAPRRPLAFYVAPFGTPPFGSAAGGERSVFGGPVEAEAAGSARRGAVERPAWGTAYRAGA